MTFDRWQYLLLMALCLVVTVPLEIVVGARVYRRPVRTLVTLVPTLAIFAAWDWFAIDRGQWWFAAKYVSGIHLGALPLEEVSFFIAIPLCALLTYESVQRILGRTSRGA